MFQPSGRAADGVHGGAGPAVDLGSAGRRGAVRAVDDDAQPGERLLERAEQVGDVVARSRPAGRGRARWRRRWAGGRRCRRSRRSARWRPRRASGSLCPPRLNNLMPLSGIGLWLAEIMTPRSAPVVPVRKASAGVGSTPARSTSAPALVRPATTAASSISPLARGSRPTTATGRSVPSRSARTLRGGTRHRQGQLRREVGVGPSPGRRRCRTGDPTDDPVSAWSTGAPCGPSSGRTSCAP